MFLVEPHETPESAELYAASVATDGYVANYLRVWSHRPDLSAQFLALRSATVAGSGLDDREVAVVNAAAASARADSYCSLAWGAKLAGRTTETAAAAVIEQRAPVDLTEREIALASWARAVVTDPGSTTQADVDRLRALGIADDDLVAVTLLAALRATFGSVNAALGAHPDGALLRNAPTSVREAVTFGRAPEAP